MLYLIYFILLSKFGLHSPKQKNVDLMQMCVLIQVADKVFAETLFKQDTDLLDVWVNYPPHPLQEQEPLGDRKWIPSFELLQVSKYLKVSLLEWSVYM